MPYPLEFKNLADGVFEVYRCNDDGLHSIGQLRKDEFGSYYFEVFSTFIVLYAHELSSLAEKIQELENGE